MVFRLLLAAPEELVAGHGERRDVLARGEAAHLRVAREAPREDDLVHGPISFPVGRLRRSRPCVSGGMTRVTLARSPAPPRIADLSGRVTRHRDEQALCEDCAHDRYGGAEGGGRGWDEAAAVDRCPRCCLWRIPRDAVEGSCRADGRDDADIGRDVRRVAITCPDQRGCSTSAAGRSISNASAAGTPTIVMGRAVGGAHTRGGKVVRGSGLEPDVHLRPGEHRGQRQGADAKDERRRRRRPASTPGGGRHRTAVCPRRPLARRHLDAAVRVDLPPGGRRPRARGPDADDDPDDACGILDAAGCQAIRSEFTPSPGDGVDVVGSAAELKAAGPLPAVPLVVLAADDHGLCAVDAAVRRRFEAKWQERQQELAASVAGGRLEVVSSGHNIQTLHPEAVIAAIRSVLVLLPASP